MCECVHRYDAMQKSAAKRMLGKQRSPRMDSTHGTSAAWPMMADEAFRNRFPSTGCRRSSKTNENQPHSS